MVKKDQSEQIESVRSSEIVLDDKDKKCAPTVNFEDGSCIPTYLLVGMADAYNESFPENKIKLYPNIRTLNPTKYKRYLLKEFSVRFENECDNQRCWLKQNFINKMETAMKEELRSFTFRPKSPQGQFTWLNTLDINKVMQQYERKYKGYKFLGAVPVDFDDLPALGIKNLDGYKMYKKHNIDKFGIIFNLDEHYKSGSHWVASFIDLKKGKVYYFDSYGVEPEPRIRKFLRRMARDAKKVSGKSDNKLDVKQNEVRHQYGGSECGVYSLAFILRLLKGESFKDITENIVTDSEINKCRKVYFS